MELGLVQKIDIENEMQQAYLDYAMSVIVSRALPDARDGLKPVHRRILYAMHDMGLRPDTSFKKSARVVGEVLGKYHPHGDMSVYDAMARMAQDFSMRYLLVEGQGNFGSIDGDPPAAMRYTEARMAPLAKDMLEDITKDTVDFSENFDGTLVEPTVLPSAIPNLLVNGATGIAVGMSTSIPPHNLAEVIDAIQHILKNWRRRESISVEELMQFVKGPDFPTGGVILQSAEGDGLVHTYSTGRGKVTVQARAHLEEMGRGRNRIIVTELPYMTNKSTLIERIANLARESRVEGIVDLRDESDRQGMRIVIELSKSAEPDVVLRELYKQTPMQNTFSIILLALVNGEPRLLNLKAALRVYIEHRLEIVRRRSEYELEKARNREHILEGLLVAIQNIDEVIDMIRRAHNVDTARKGLIRRFKLSELQAQAILDMPLRRLSALERRKIDEEYRDVRAQIRHLESLLHSPTKMRQVVSEELEAVREAYSDRRRTLIVDLQEGKRKVSLLTTTELVPEKTIWVAVTPDGLISRTIENRQPRLSGKEAPGWLIKANTRDTLYLVADDGQAAALPVHAVPETERLTGGAPLIRLAPIKEDTNLAAIFTVPALGGKDKTEAGFDDMFVLTASQLGMIKKSTLSELPGASAEAFTLVRVNKGDRLGWLAISNGSNDILLVTANGMAIRFNEEEVRPMGLVAAGVMGIKLQKSDQVIGMDLLPDTGEIFLVTTIGRAKRVKGDQFPKQGRYGQGVVAWKLPPREKIVGMTIGKGTTRASFHMSRLLPKTIRLDDAPVLGRTATKGKSIQEMRSRNKITKLMVPWEPPRPSMRKGRPQKATRISKSRKK